MVDIHTIPQRMTRPLYQFYQYQGRTNDCGPASLAIAANALLGEERFLKDDVADEMNDPSFTVRPFPHFVVRRIKNWATFPWGIVNYLREKEIPARWSPFGSVNRLQRNLANDLITLVFVGQPLQWKDGKYNGWAHIKILYGYQPGKGYVFVDPGRRKRPDSPDSWASLGLFWQDEDKFLNYWNGLLRIYVEVG